MIEYRDLLVMLCGWYPHNAWDSSETLAQIKSIVRNTVAKGALLGAEYISWGCLIWVVDEGAEDP